MCNKALVLMVTNGGWDISGFTACHVDTFENWKYTESHIYTCTGFRYSPHWREKHWKRCFKRDQLLIIKLWKSFGITHLYMRLISSISEKEQSDLYKLFLFYLNFCMCMHMCLALLHACSANGMHATWGSDHWGLDYKWLWTKRQVLGTLWEWEMLFTAEPSLQCLYKVFGI